MPSRKVVRQDEESVAEGCGENLSDTGYRYIIVGRGEGDETRTMSD